MNSVEGYKGFISFMVLSLIVLTALVGFNYISKPTDSRSRAANQDPSPQNVYTQNITSNSAEIIWYTFSPSQAKVVFTDNTEFCDNNIQSCFAYEETAPVNDHFAQLTALLPNKTYLFKIQIGETLYPSAEPYSFTTTSETTDQIITEVNDEPVVPPPPQKPAINLPDYYGIYVPENLDSSKSFEEGFESDTQEVLGKQTNIVDQMIVEEFQSAMENNDLDYDFNKDEKVTTEDYPLFIEFITNSED